MSERVGILGVFDRAGALARALRECRARRLEVLDVYSPVQDEELIELGAPGQSPVRLATLVGALSGMAAGFGLALYTSGIWELVVGGKPVYSLVPFIVVGFELTILFGALFTLLGMLVFARLPFRRFPAPGYRPEFSVDRYGVVLAAGPGERDEARRALDGALEVQEVELPAKTRRKR